MCCWEFASVLTNPSLNCTIVAKFDVSRFGSKSPKIQEHITWCEIVLLTGSFDMSPGQFQLKPSGLSEQ